MAIVVGTLGNNNLPGTSGSDQIFGDFGGTLSNVQLGNGFGNDNITARGSDALYAGGGDSVFGDAGQLADYSIGGNDVISSIGKIYNLVHGDASLMFSSIGGNDTISNSSSAGFEAYGDAYDGNDSDGGNDVITNNGVQY